ncbi:acyl-CoA reductase [Metabacillus fastidiosus]|uniref:acyl-CoA reductase n=1 Tax=Metabacillus fastidiosus TaxID=1458 RepID=UPI003D2BF67C
MDVIAGYTPTIDEEWDTHILTFENKGEKLNIHMPLLTAEQLIKVSEKIKNNSGLLKSFSVMELVSIIDQTVAAFLDRSNPYRKKAEELLPVITGYDKEMIRTGLTSYLKTFRKQELQRFLVEDFQNPLLLDDFQPRTKTGYSKAVGPDLITHIWAGNVPGLPIWSLISGILVKSGNIGKVSSSEPLFSSLFVQQLIEIEPRLKDSLAVCWWRGGDKEKEKALFHQSDVVVGYGGNESLESLRTKIPLSTRFLPYGHKISFGIISSSSLDSNKGEKTAHAAAYDVIRYDQQGCYSPQAFYVQRGGNITPKQFARMLGRELESYENRYPRRSLSLEETVNIASWRQKEEFHTFSNQENEIIGETSHNWTVVYEDENKELSPSSLNRTIKVIAFDEYSELIPYLRKNRSFLQTAGVALTPEELFHTAELLSSVGVTRITALGHMTSPEAGWHHDGRFNLLDLVNFVDIENYAKEYSENFAPYTD